MNYCLTLLKLIILFLIILFLIIFSYKLLIKDNFKNPDNYIFSKIILDNKLILIFPVYNKEIKLEEFQIHLNNYNINLIKEIKKIEQEPIHIFIYNIKQKLNTTDIVTGTFNYNNSIENFNIYPIFTNKKHKLAITTLFKDDYELFPIFYDYYSKQGVSLFIMYYNGISNSHIKDIFNKKNIILIDWNYRYWNPKNIKYNHHAQVGQIYDSLYKYAKPLTEYIIYCDLDEYLYIPNKTILKYIENNNYLDVIEFNNYFASTLDNKIPQKIPNKIKIGEKHNYKTRSKNIYKSSSIDSINIHYPHKFNKIPFKSRDNMMFHFHSWSNRHEKLNNIFDLQ